MKFKTDTIAKRARKRCVNLKTFANEGVTLRERDMDLINVGEGGSVWGRAGYTGGWVRYGDDVFHARLQEVIVHEFCHVVQMRLQANRSLRNNRGRFKDNGHGQIFKSLLLAASKEFFKMTRDESKAVIAKWNDMKEAQKNDLAEHRKVIRNAVNREPWNRDSKLDEAYFEIRLSQRHGYLLDDAIMAVLKKRI